MIIESPLFIKNPLASVIICTYNQEQYIHQTIDSILVQQCDFPFEIIIGEDFGTDGTRAICREYQLKYPDKIKLLLYEENGGLVKNYIGCVNQCRGSFLTGCGGDDFWHNPDKLQLQVDYMRSNPSCGVLHTDFNKLNSNTGKTTESYYKRTNKEMVEGYVQKHIFYGTLSMTAPTICYRKDLIDKYVDLNKFIELDFPIEDWPMLMILSNYGEVNYLPISTITYRRGHESLSNLASYDKILSKYKREKVMTKYLVDLFPEFQPFNEIYYDTYVNRILLNLAYKKLDYRSARKYASAINSKAFKVRFAKNPIVFYVFGLMKRVREKYFSQ